MMQIYIDILDGKISVNDGKELIGTESDANGFEVFVTPAAIVATLIRYLVGDIDSEYLCKWATFLIGNDVYVTKGWEDDVIADRYEPMWEILQMLSTPNIDGTVNKERAEEFIEVLNKLD